MAASMLMISTMIYIKTVLFTEGSSAHLIAHRNRAKTCVFGDAGIKPEETLLREPRTDVRINVPE